MKKIQPLVLTLLLFLGFTACGESEGFEYASSDSDTKDGSKTICFITLFFSLGGQGCEQQVVFTYNKGANTSLESNINNIITSISQQKYR